jgi:hypothetical protein
MAAIAEREVTPAKVARRAATPVAGAIAGIVFAVLFSASAIILRRTWGGDAGESGAWLTGDTEPFKFALALVPFAGLAFLWFIAVARERLGRFEDQFFSTVFIGSGLLFLAMVFAGAATAGAILAAAEHDPAGFAASTTYGYARQAVAQIHTVYALRMAAVFQLSQATLWLRTGVMPRWTALLTYVVALVLLFVFTASWWVVLVFPAWVLLISVYILIARLGGRQAVDGGDQPVRGRGLLNCKPARYLRVHRALSERSRVGLPSPRDTFRPAEFRRFPMVGNWYSVAVAARRSWSAARPSVPATTAY